MEGENISESIGFGDILVAIRQSSSRADQRFDRIDGRNDVIDSRIARLEKMVTSCIEKKEKTIV